MFCVQGVLTFLRVPGVKDLTKIKNKNKNKNKMKIKSK